MVRDRTVTGPEIGPTAEIVVNITLIVEEGIITMTETIDPIIELELGLEMVMEGMICMLIDQAIEGTISDRIEETKGIEIEV